MSSLPIPSAPDWVRDAIFYQIFPDRFCRSKSYMAPGRFRAWGERPDAESFWGGNLLGILDQLDHIQELGCTALYLCPIFASTANHRYHTQDYFRIDPVLGTEEHFDQLVAEVHRRGMRIILDGVFNHCSRGFYAFNSLLENGKNSPFLDWFHVEGWPLNAYSTRAKPNYQCWWNIPALPKFNTANPEVREYLWSVGEYWMRRGIDGWRLDVPNEIDDDSFWREFRRRVKAIRSDAYIVGEIWEEPTRWLQGDQFDGVMNYPARRALLEAFFPEELGRPENLSTGEPAAVLAAHGTQGISKAKNFCDQLHAALPSDRFGVPFNLLGSHDNIRLATLGRLHIDAQLMAWAALLFLPGAVCVYAGDEVGLEGGKDPDNRRCFPWDLLQTAKEKEPWHTLQALITLRRTSAVMRRGSFFCHPEGDGVVLIRELGHERLELRLGYPGAVGLPPAGPERTEMLSHRVTTVEGRAGRMVQAQGFAVTLARK